MNWTIHNVYGLLHVVTASIAVLCACIILFSKKGTVFHKRVGYTYVICILILNISSFGVMEFFKGKPGPFHMGAIVSLIFTTLGIIPVMRKKGKNYLQRHYVYISGSLIGLFAAFFVEAVFRSFHSALLIIVSTIGISAIVAIVGGILIRKFRSHFFKEDGSYKW